MNLKDRLNLKEGDIKDKDKDMEEAHDMAGVLFLESMVVTDSYNELKKQCKKVKR